MFIGILREKKKSNSSINSYFIFSLCSDLKLEHVVITPEGHIRLVDYGLGRLLRTPNELCYTVCGTRGYMAPEV